MRGTDAPLILTKIHRPRPRADLAPRPRLLEEFESGWEEPVTLVVGPAGYGKSSLVSVWAEAETSWRVAWLSIDEADNDPVRFFTYMAAALSDAGVLPADATEHARRLESEGPDVWFLPWLMNTVASTTTPCVLVLDDYHLIDESVVHTGVEWLADHAPRHLRLVITSRSHPPLPLARWAAKRQVVIIDESHLGFQPDEAVSLFALGFDVNLPETVVERLVTATEGWPAALTMAGLSLSRSADREGFVERFTGRDRSVVDYLASEVLATVDHELKSFLMETSILQRLCAPLCDAVTGRSDADRMLNALEDRHLFILGLDNQRRWFRYHHLFADWLGFELTRAEPSLIPSLHRRASDWFADQGLPGEAIHHALKAGDDDRAADLVASYARDYLDRGRRRTLADWINQIDEGAVDHHPWLYPVMAFTSMLSGLGPDGSAWLSRGQHALERLDPDGPEAKALEVDLAAVRPLPPLFAGEYSEATSLAADSVDAFQGMTVEQREATAFDETLAEATWGTLLFVSDRTQEAHDLLFDVVESGAGAATGRVLAGGMLAAALLDMRRTAEARQRATEALELADEAYESDNMTMLAALSVLAVCGDDDVAETAQGRIDTYLNRAPYALLIGWISAYMVRHFINRGDLAEARRRLDEGGAAAKSLAEAGLIERLLDEARSELDRVAAGQPGATGEELSERELTVLKALAGPLTRREIGRELHLSHNTVKTYTQSVYKKLGVSSREDAVAKARRMGLIS